MDRSAVRILQAALCLIVLVIFPCARILWLREVVLNRTKQQDGCQGDEFRCTSGECIDTVSMCDGTKKCADGSDETKTVCKLLNTTDLPSIPRRGGCLLPQPPEFGTYNAVECAFGNKTAFCRKIPGTLVPQKFALTFRCNKGYYIKETEDETLNTTCVNGKWLPQIPVCSKLCPPLVSLSVHIRCFNGDKDIDCSKPMRLGTRAKGECKPFSTQIRLLPYTDIFCTNDGQWSGELLECLPVCGKVNIHAVNNSLTVNDFATKHGEFPWYVNLIEFDEEQGFHGEQRCGGILISPHIVLTAAFWVTEAGKHFRSRQKSSPTRFKVGLGKGIMVNRGAYRQWNRDESYGVLADVREIIIHPMFFAQRISFYADYNIALLDLTTSIQLHASILPVCVDWRREFTITPGTLGKFAFWGTTGPPTYEDVLLYADLPYIDYGHCLNKLPPQGLDRYVTPEKFCAGLSNGADLTLKDGGAGLTFVHEDLHYVYGMFSRRSKSIAIFINVSNLEILDWLYDAKRTLDEEHPKICTPTSFQCAYGACIDGNKRCDGKVDCADGSDEADLECTQTTTTITTTTPQVAVPEVQAVLTCKNTEFRCLSGECMDHFLFCDGRADCADGSDENESQCENNFEGCLLPETPEFGNYTAPVCASNSHNSEVCSQVPGTPVSQNWLLSFKCHEGYYMKGILYETLYTLCVNGKWSPKVPVCVPLSLPQREDCLLPQPPEFGDYTATECAFDNKTAVCRQVPGTPVPQNFVLSFNCNKGYYIKETEDETFYTVCVNGKWSPKIPICKKMCRPLVSLNVAVRCYIGVGDVDCSKPMRPGTRAKEDCKPFYTQTEPRPYTEIICTVRGRWSHELLHCQPVCGKRNLHGVNNSLIVNGSATKYSEFPWHVGLYLRNASEQWEQTCGGSLISTDMVLTAAYCVFSELRKAKIRPEEIKLGLGKYYREWTHDEPYAVQANVRKVLISPSYNGQATRFTHDIALLELTDSVKIHASIMPVCVDWKREFKITPGTLGTLPCWGKTENGTPSDVLLHADLPYIDYDHCIHEVPPVFQHYVTRDKFCSGFSNDTGATTGERGGGLTFVQDDLHYVYGIASTKLKLPKSFLSFTNMSSEELLNWVEYATQKPSTSDEVHRETERSCFLPEVLELGTQFYFHGCYLDSGNEIYFTNISDVRGYACNKVFFICNEGYYFEGDDFGDGKHLAFCFNGEWRPEIPVCKKMCSPLVSLTVAVTCFNEKGDIDCTKHMRPGTRAKGECKPFYRQIWSPLYTEIVCESNGQWSYELFDCQPEMCSPLVSLSVAVTCFNAEGYIDCNKLMHPGTRAKVECKPSYTQIRPPPYTEIICRETGQWSDELFYCRPVCGKRNTQGVNNPLIKHGSTTKYGEFPWHVGLYWMSGSNEWEQMCGGSLISPHVVMTAAHCVFSEPIKAKLPPEAIKVGLGKYYREWTRDEPYAVKADVREILIPPKYFGQSTSYTQDIALLDLTHSVQLNAYILPVCVDWKREFIITPGALGTIDLANVKGVLMEAAKMAEADLVRYFYEAKEVGDLIPLLKRIFLSAVTQMFLLEKVVQCCWTRFRRLARKLTKLPGWGKTENASPSDVLLYADLPYIDYRQCVDEVPQVFQHYVTADKFCGGYTNGTGAAKGDSGGGLTFVYDDLDYVYGIVSTTVQMADSFATFTNISNEEILKWINYTKLVFDAAHPET